MYSRKRVRKGRVVGVAFVALFVVGVAFGLAWWIVQGGDGESGGGLFNRPQSTPAGTEGTPPEPTPPPRPTLELAMNISTDNIAAFLENQQPVAAFVAEIRAEYFWQRNGTQSAALYRRLYIVQDGVKIEYTDANEHERHVWFSGGRVYEWVGGEYAHAPIANPLQPADFLNIPEVETLIVDNLDGLREVRREVRDGREFIFVELVNASTNYRYELYISTDFVLLEQARVYDDAELIYEMRLVAPPSEDVPAFARPQIEAPPAGDNDGT
ncbi:MAG: hypothetical protein FWE06_00025 [Oscillospiraceae bacterium]|nr:hypothetical protein [Oscillospiraceae bacterium]